MLARGPRALVSGTLKAAAIGLMDRGIQMLSTGNTALGIALVVVSVVLLIADQYFLNRVEITSENLDQVKARGIMWAP